MGKTLFLLRHGDTGAKGRFMGATDVPLAAEGYSQLDLTRERLRHEEIGTVLCSPMLRCRKTVEHLRLQAPVTVHDELREINFGAWEGKTFAEIACSWPEKVREWGQWSEQFTFPGGDNIGEFLGRLRRVQEWVTNCPDERILLVTHGGVIRHLICAYLGLSPEKYLLFEVRPGRYAALDLHSDGGILTCLNCG